MRFQSWHVVILLGLLGLPLAFQNCGESFEGTWDSGAPLSQIRAPEGPTADPETDTTNPTLPSGEPPPNQPEPLPAALQALQPNLIADCATNPNFNSCLFWKNPVAQRGMAFATPIGTTSNLDNLLVHAVNIRGVDGSGFLRNTTIDVNTTTGNRVQVMDGNYRRSYVAQAHQVTQLMVYHWMQTSVDFMKHQAGRFHAEGRGVLVDAVSSTVVNDAFYRVSTNQVTMGRTSGGTNFGLSGEISVHELAHANHRHASGYNFSTTNTQVCPDSVGGTCCTSASQGCHRALAEGSSDYAYAIIFPSNVTGGETITNNVQGPARCGLNRNIVENINLSVTNTPCANIHVLGMIYAGMWFRVRQQSEQLRPGQGARQVDTLFSEHLMVLGNDTWASIFTKIVTLDQSLFAGLHRDLFLQEFRRRGINVSL